MILFVAMILFVDHSLFTRALSVLYGILLLLHMFVGNSLFAREFTLSVQCLPKSFNFASLDGFFRALGEGGVGVWGGLGVLGTT